MAARATTIRPRNAGPTCTQPRGLAERRNAGGRTAGHPATRSLPRSAHPMSHQPAKRPRPAEEPGDDEECVPGPVMTPDTFQLEWKRTVDEWTGQESVRAASSPRAADRIAPRAQVFIPGGGQAPHVPRGPVAMEHSRDPSRVPGPQAAESMIPLIGQLYRERNVVTTMFGKGMVNVGAIDLLKVHRWDAARAGPARPRSSYRSAPRRLVALGASTCTRPFPPMCPSPSSARSRLSTRLPPPGWTWARPPCCARCAPGRTPPHGPTPN